MRTARSLKLLALTASMALLGAPAAFACTDAQLEGQYAGVCTCEVTDGAGTAPSAAAMAPPATPEPTPAPAATPSLPAAGGSSTGKARPQPAATPTQVARPQAETKRAETARPQPAGVEARSPKRKEAVRAQPIATQPAERQQPVARTQTAERQSAPVAPRTTVTSPASSERGSGVAVARRDTAGATKRRADSSSRRDRVVESSASSTRDERVPVTPAEPRAERATPVAAANGSRSAALELVAGALVLLLGAVAAAGALARRRRRPAELTAEARASLATEAALQEMIAEEHARGGSEHSAGDVPAGR